MKSLISLSVLCVSVLLMGCNSEHSSDSVYENDNIVVDNKISDTILISGQSNANVCDWHYFESKTGYKTLRIAKGGSTISQLITAFYNEQPISEVYEKMIFIHGENDAWNETDPSDYISMVHEYIGLTGSVDIYFSTVGYSTNSDDDYKFDSIRNAVRQESGYIESWHIGFDDAYTFRDRDMLIDTVHFSGEACIELMDSIALKMR